MEDNGAFLCAGQASVNWLHHITQQQRLLKKLDSSLCFVKKCTKLVLPVHLTSFKRKSILAIWKLRRMKMSKYVSGIMFAKMFVRLELSSYGRMVSALPQFYVFNRGNLRAVVYLIKHCGFTGRVFLDRKSLELSGDFDTVMKSCGMYGIKPIILTGEAPDQIPRAQTGCHASSSRPASSQIGKPRKHKRKTGTKETEVSIPRQQPSPVKKDLIGPVENEAEQFPRSAASDHVRHTLELNKAKNTPEADPVFSDEEKIPLGTLRPSSSNLVKPSIEVPSSAASDHVTQTLELNKAKNIPEADLVFSDNEEKKIPLGIVNPSSSKVPSSAASDHVTHTLELDKAKNTPEANPVFSDNDEEEILLGSIRHPVLSYNLLKPNIEVPSSAASHHVTHITPKEDPVFLDDEEEILLGTISQPISSHNLLKPNIEVASSAASHHVTHTLKLDKANNTPKEDPVFLDDEEEILLGTISQPILSHNLVKPDPKISGNVEENAESSTAPNSYPSDQELAFLKYLGWKDEAAADDFLTEKEIKEFKKLHMDKLSVEASKGKEVKLATSTASPIVNSAASLLSASGSGSGSAMAPIEEKVAGANTSISSLEHLKKQSVDACEGREAELATLTSAGSLLSASGTDSGVVPVEEKEAEANTSNLSSEIKEKTSKKSRGGRRH